MQNGCISSPRGYGWILVVNHRLKLLPLFLLLHPVVSPRAKGEVSHTFVIHSFYFVIIVCYVQNLTPL
jgi:hypothetical protein